MGQTARDPENTALRIGDILAPHHDLRIALHLLTKAVVDGIDHGHGLYRHIVRHDLRRRGFAGIDMGQEIRRRRLRVTVGLGGRLIDLGFDGRSESLDLLRRQNTVPDEVTLGSEDGVALGKAGQLFGRTIFAVVVR
jgi:hypothetical protein